MIEFDLVITLSLRIKNEFRQFRNIYIFLNFDNYFLTACTSTQSQLVILLDIENIRNDTMKWVWLAFKVLPEFVGGNIG